MRFKAIIDNDLTMLERKVNAFTKNESVSVKFTNTSQILDGDLKIQYVVTIWYRLLRQ